jgi:hypothetical protein
MASLHHRVGPHSRISRARRSSNARFGIFLNREGGRWGEGLTAEDMKKRCRWLKSQLVAAIEFLEWNARLRHPTFVALRDDKIAADAAGEDARST